MPIAESLTVALPAYNEEANIAAMVDEVVRTVTPLVRDLEVVIVDDGSRDRTSDVARAALDGRVPYRIIRFGENRGKGAAVKAGVLTSAGRAVLFTDADLSAPIEELDKFLPKLEEGFDVVIGSRAIPGCDIRVPQAPPRQAMGRFFNRLVRLFVMSGCNDTQCGFKLFRREVALELFTRLGTAGFAFDVEILLLARKLGYKVSEVPVVWCDSRPSRVGILRGSWRMLRELLAIRRLR